MENTDTIEQRVEKGAKLLDGKIPDWFKEIDTGVLHIGSLFDCIMGQLACKRHSSFARLTIDFGLEHCSDDVAHGFDADAALYEHDEQIAQLNTAWKAEIGKRWQTEIHGAV